MARLLEQQPVAPESGDPAESAGTARATARALATALAIHVGFRLTLVVAALVISGEGLPPREAVLYALAAGVCGVSALGFFYSGLAIGTMSIVAPISALMIHGSVPVLVNVRMPSFMENGPTLWSGRQPSADLLNCQSL